MSTQFIRSVAPPSPPAGGALQCEHLEVACQLAAASGLSGARIPDFRGLHGPRQLATDIAGGSQFGYTLLSVIMISNLMAILLQSLSLKLGVATERIWRRFAARATGGGSASDCGLARRLRLPLATWPR